MEAINKIVETTTEIPTIIANSFLENTLAWKLTNFLYLIGYLPISILLRIKNLEFNFRSHYFNNFIMLSILKL